MTQGKGGEELLKSVQAQELANAKKQLENSGPFRPRVVVKIHILESGRFQFIKEKGICRGPLAVGPAFHGRRRKTKSCLILHPVPPIPFDSRTQWPVAAFSLAGEGCGEGNFSADVELLRADCR